MLPNHMIGEELLMKKLIFLITVFVFLLLAGCANPNQTSHNNPSVSQEIGAGGTPPQMVYFPANQDVDDFLALLTKSEEEVESALDGTNIAFNGVSTLFDVHRVVARLLRCPRFLGDDDSFVMIYYTDGKYLTVNYYMDTMRLSYFVRAGTNLAGKAEQCPYATTITIDGKDIDLYKTDSGNYVGEYLDGAYLCSLAIYDCDDPTAVDYDRFLGWQDFPDGYTDPDESVPRPVKPEDIGTTAIEYHMETVRELDDFLALAEKDDRTLEEGLGGSLFGSKELCSAEEARAAARVLSQAPRYLDSDGGFSLYYWPQLKNASTTYELDSASVTFSVKSKTPTSDIGEDYVCTVLIGGQQVELYSFPIDIPPVIAYIGHFQRNGFYVQIVVRNCPDPTTIDFDKYLAWRVPDET